MRTKVVILALLVALLHSCTSTSSKEERYVDFDALPTFEITPQQVNKQEVIAGSAFPFAIVDSLFFLFNSDPSSGAIVLRASDASEVGHFLTKGNGYGECLAPNFMGYSGDTIFVNEQTSPRKMAYVYSLEGDSLSYRCVSDVRSTHTGMFYTDAVRLDNGLSVGVRMMGENHLFALLDAQLDTLRTFGKLPLEHEGDLLTFKGYLTSEGNICYFVAQDYAYMAAYKIDGQDVQPLYERMYVAPEIKGKEHRIVLDAYKHRKGFYDIAVQGDYLFASYSGRILNDSKSDMAALVPTTLLVFDRQGHPLAKFTLPMQFGRIGATPQKLYMIDLDSNIYSIDLAEIERCLETGNTH